MVVSMKDQVNPPGLYVVGTPIGNLQDLSDRAKQILSEVDWIAAEDTRETAKLLNAFAIQKPLISLHEHSTKQKILELMERLQAGERGAYVSDAGTPGISDPGAALVKACHEAEIQVIPVPGPSAVSTLLSACGFDASAFTFKGFFPREKADRKAWAEEVTRQGGVQVFFESPHRVKECLHFLAENFPNEILVMGRELTKKFETIRFNTTTELADIYAIEEARGEFVFALSLPVKSAEKDQVDQVKLEAFLRTLVPLGGDQKLLVAVAKEWGLRKNEAYELVLKVLNK